MLCVLGIETSCDETAVAIVKQDKTILAHLIRSQIQEHQPYGGVVPELAARAHISVLDLLIQQALQQAQCDYWDLSCIAVTTGPGLIGGLIVGVMMAKALAFTSNLPFLGINHLDAHALTIRLIDTVAFPYVVLLVSGGHCQLLVAHGVGQYTFLGTTLDDAVGEAFDKVAKILGLSYPGGPEIERIAHQASNPRRFCLPRPLLGVRSCNFSFSGLKSAVSRLVNSQRIDFSKDIPDLAAAFQNTVTEVLCDRCNQAFKYCQTAFPNCRTLVVSGGVAANHHIRKHLKTLAQTYGFSFFAPPLDLCTDNAAMVAWAGVERLVEGTPPDHLDLVPRPRWPLSLSVYG